MIRRDFLKGCVALGAVQAACSGPLEAPADTVVEYYRLGHSRMEKIGETGYSGVSFVVNISELGDSVDTRGVSRTFSAFRHEPSGRIGSYVASGANGVAVVPSVGGRIRGILFDTSALSESEMSFIYHTNDMGKGLKAGRYATVGRLPYDASRPDGMIITAGIEEYLVEGVEWLNNALVDPEGTITGGVSWTERGDFRGGFGIYGKHFGYHWRNNFIIRPDMGRMDSIRAVACEELFELYYNVRNGTDLFSAGDSSNTEGRISDKSGVFTPKGKSVMLFGSYMSP